MANDGEKEKIGGDIPSGSGKNADPNVEEDNCNEESGDNNLRENDVGQEGNAPKKACQGEYHNESDLQVWKDRSLKRDGEIKGMANKLADLQLVVNFMMQNNIMEPLFPLEDMSIPATKNDAQKGGQKVIPVVPQHDRAKEHSHQSLREVGQGESMRGESQKTPRAKETYVKEHRHVQGEGALF
ncbi:hypothetical protein ACSBR1_041120 [Camellia fascicularis]